MAAERTLVMGDPVIPLGDHAPIPDGAVIVEGDVIVDVGPRTRLQRQGPFARTIGGPDDFVMPGFVNGHYHTECFTAPGIFDVIFEIGHLAMGSGLIDTTLEIIELLATNGLVQAVKGGQTTTVDTFYGRPNLPLLGAEGALRAYDAVGMRTAFAVTLRDQNVYAHEDDAAFLAKLPPAVAAEVRASPLGYAWPVDDVFAVYHQLVERWEGRDNRFRIILGPDWTPSCSDELYLRCRRTADECGTLITTHVLETRAEMMWNLEVYGKPAARRLADLGVLGPDVSFAHFVWATDEDIRILADTGVTAVHCIGSNLRCFSGLCRARDIIAQGGRLAFGTDGASVGDREDFFEEIRVALMMQRQPDHFGSQRLDSASVLRDAAANGARAAGFAGKVGELTPGAFADLLCVDKRRIFFPRTRYESNPFLDVVVDRADAGDIRTVMIGGKVVVEEGRVTTIDEERLRARIDELQHELYKPSPQAEHRRALAAQMRPLVEDLCGRWYDYEVEPAAVFNTRTAPRRRMPPPQGGHDATV
jgi:5-methylthioadenosine/S-adenosylhomocysteine deaminase